MLRIVTDKMHEKTAWQLNCTGKRLASTHTLLGSSLKGEERFAREEPQWSKYWTNSVVWIKAVQAVCRGWEAFDHSLQSRLTGRGSQQVSYALICIQKVVFKNTLDWVVNFI